MSRRCLSDDEILDIQLHAGDPRASYSLLAPDEVPENPKWIRLVAIYHSHEEIKCMRRDCGQMHNEGAVVEIEFHPERVGQMVVGHVCGAKLFPEEYKAGGTRFGGHVEHRNQVLKKREALARELMLHRNLILRKRAILQKETDIRAWFNQAKLPFGCYDRVRRDFESYMPDLLACIQDAIRGSHGQLAVSDTARKSRFREALQDLNVGGRIVDDVTTVIHIVAGPRFFDRGELVERTAKAANECAVLLERLRPDNLSVREMQEATNGLARIGERLERMTRQYLDMFPAMAGVNLQGVARWHRRFDPASPYRYVNGGLHRQATRGLPAFHLKAIEDKPLQFSGFPILKIA